MVAVMDLTAGPVIAMAEANSSGWRRADYWRRM